MAARAASNTAAVAFACAAAPAASAADVFSQLTYGAAARAIAIAAAPCHDPSAKPAVTDENETAAESSSPAKASHAAAAASIGPDPAPANIRAELISGGKIVKFIMPNSSQLQLPNYN
ncbi:hypothetical protein MSHI_30770 [Mycobacterium shinjukuense]|uniref:Uncharacterized protein n=1 Tax=Mycobacterium shinjukuense TaxID=398694 RepID=A0A7I7MSG2_9MYCO|nr:hypothetical protein MSHI_30770 [Mycobacterium shinjukuense]